MCDIDAEYKLFLLGIRILLVCFSHILMAFGYWPVNIKYIFKQLLLDYGSNSPAGKLFSHFIGVI